MHIKDLFKSLVYNKIGTTEVYKLCGKLCKQILSKKSQLINMVMKWKYSDAQKSYRNALYFEKKLWKSYSELYNNENITNQYNQLWYKEKNRAMKKCREKRVKKLKWLRETYTTNNKKDLPPDYINGICIKDGQLDGEFDQQPAIYGNANLDENEVSAIKMHPKFTVYNKIDPLDCEAEVEKCLTSIRWSRNFNNDGNTRVVFDDEKKTLDLRKMRATDLPFCSNVVMPKPLTFDDERKLQNLKHELNTVVLKYKCKSIKWKNIKTNQEVGLKSLVERRNKKELVMFQTDKSGKMSVDTVDNYIEDVQHHIKDDRIIDAEEFARIEKKVNAHARFWCNMLNVGTHVNDVDRIKTSIKTHNSDFSNIYFYRKDHKPPLQKTLTNGDTTVSHPFRPLCDVSDSYSHKFSYLMCTILREITIESTTVCNSSEDLIARIQELNKK